MAVAHVHQLCLHPQLFQQRLGAVRTDEISDQLVALFLDLCDPPSRLADLSQHRQGHQVFDTWRQQLRWILDIGRRQKLNQLLPQLIIDFPADKWHEALFHGGGELIRRNEDLTHLQAVPKIDKQLLANCRCEGCRVSHDLSYCQFGNSVGFHHSRYDNHYVSLVL